MQYSEAITKPHIFCYSLASWMPYDPELIWELVQRHSGYMTILPAGSYEFYIDSQYAVILVMAFPQLARQYQKDLYV